MKNLFLPILILIFLFSNIDIYGQTQSNLCQAPVEIVILIPNTQSSNAAYKTCRENHIKNFVIPQANKVYADAGIKLVIKKIGFKSIPPNGPGYNYNNNVEIPYDPSNCLTENKGITVTSHDFDKNDFLEPAEAYPNFQHQRIYFVDYVKIPKGHNVYTFAFTVPIERAEPRRLLVYEVLSIKKNPQISQAEQNTMPAHEGVHFGFYRKGSGDVDDHKYDAPPNQNNPLPPNNIMNSFGSKSMTPAQKELLKNQKCLSKTGGPGTVIPTPGPLTPGPGGPTSPGGPKTSYGPYTPLQQVPCPTSPFDFNTQICTGADNCPLNYYCDQDTCSCNIIITDPPPPAT